MKQKIYIAALLLLWFWCQTTVASCDPSEMTDIICGLNGVTITRENVCNFISDTSAWKVYTAYDGACREYPEVGVEEKQKIYVWLEKIFKKYTVLANQGVLRVYPIRESLSEQLYDLLLARIQKEYSKWIQSASLEKMAKFHYAASLIGYNYNFHILPDEELY